MNNNPVPTLSSSGWVYSASHKLQFLLSYFYESLYSQSQLYYTNITSMSYLLYQYGTDPYKFASEVETSLKNYLSRYLNSNNLIVECTANSSTTSTNGISSINMYIQFTNENGKIVTLSNLLNVSGNKIVSVINTVNGTN